jgi:hypothetical protein
MKVYVNCRKGDIKDNDLYRAAVARYYLAEACKKPKKRNLAELATRYSYIGEAARVAKDIIDDETYVFMTEKLPSVGSFEKAIDELKDAMDYRSPAFIPDFRVLSSAANSFQKYDGTPWIETLQEVNNKRKELGLETLPL